MYEAEVILEGGSGRASITSPAVLTLKEGEAVLTVEWSSPNYDYMLVDGEKYLPTANEEAIPSLPFLPPHWTHL